MKLGKAFSDSLIIEKKTRTRFISDPHGAWWLGSGRALLFSSLLCLIFFILIFRLFALTIIDGHRYRVLADGNRTRELVIHASRGILFDRTGKPLVANIAQYRLISPCQEKINDICIVHLSKEEGEKLSKSGLPAGSFLEVEYMRQYLYPEATAHVVGYTGELTSSELTDDYYTIRKYRRGDRVGKMGAEAVFEERLRGRDGRELVEIDATGKILRVLGRDAQLAGENITLSLDAGIEEAAARAFPAGSKGAVVVTKPQTGEILALYSAPSFSLNAFSFGMAKEDYRAFAENADRPMFDRAIGGVYPPGSTFKLVTSLAALEEGVIDKNTTIEDTGVITLGPFSFPNWYFLKYNKTEGQVDIVKALERSNDIFFYKTGERLGIHKLADWARRVGVGKTLGIELPGEAAGLMPDPVWKNLNFVSKEDRQARNNLWFTGDTYHVSIGQGYLLATPLQVNTWTNVVGSGGKLCRPSILKSQSANCKDLHIKKDSLERITEGMKRACETGGTGWPLFDFGIRKNAGASASSSGTLTKIPVACKTGTAEFGDPKNRTHAWFTTFAPVADPEISVTVLVEEAGEGSDVAAPVAKKILEAWFSR